jgi:hypothetical protein
MLGFDRRAIEIVAERKIEEAMANGEFDNNPYAGKPLPPDDLERVPEELRMGYKILKNAEILPPELVLHQEILRLQNLLRECAAGDDKNQLQQQLAQRQNQYNILMEERLGRPLKASSYQENLAAYLASPR